MHRSALALTTVSFFITGCFKVGPDFTPPLAPVEPCWQASSWQIEDFSAPGLNSCCNPPQQWWRLLSDPLLDALVAQAEWASPTVQQALYRIGEARAILGIAIGELFPQQQELVGSSVRFKLSKNSPNSMAADLNYVDHQLGLQAAWELDIWGRYRRAIESAQDFLWSQVADYEDVLLLLRSDIASSYTSIREMQELIAVVEANVAVQRRSVQIAQVRYEVGLVTELDVKQAEALLESTSARLPRLHKQMIAFVNALAALVGTTPSEIQPLFEAGGRLPEIAFEEVCIGVPAELLCRRPDLRKAMFDAAAQSARIGIAMADMLPKLSLSGFVGFESSSDTMSTKTGGGGKFFSGNSFTYFGGPIFSWPVLNYGRLVNHVRAERARFEQLVCAYQEKVLIAQEEVESALTLYLDSQIEARSLEKSSRAAERAVELANKQYVEGDADYTRVLNSQEQQLQQQELLVRARADIVRGLIQSYRAVGGGSDSAK